jgi:hypothetical protein
MEHTEVSHRGMASPDFNKEHPLFLEEVSWNRSAFRSRGCVLREGNLCREQFSLVLHVYHGFALLTNPFSRTSNVLLFTHLLHSLDFYQQKHNKGEFKFYQINKLSDMEMLGWVAGYKRIVASDAEF